MMDQIRSRLNRVDEAAKPTPLGIVSIEKCRTVRRTERLGKSPMSGRRKIENGQDSELKTERMIVLIQLTAAAHRAQLTMQSLTMA